MWLWWMPSSTLCNPADLDKPWKCTKTVRDLLSFLLKRRDLAVIVSVCVFLLTIFLAQALSPYILYVNVTSCQEPLHTMNLRIWMFRNGDILMLFMSLFGDTSVKCYFLTGQVCHLASHLRPQTNWSRVSLLEVPNWKQNDPQTNKKWKWV